MNPLEFSRIHRSVEMFIFDTIETVSHLEPVRFLHQVAEDVHYGVKSTIEKIVDIWQRSIVPFIHEVYSQATSVFNYLFNGQAIADVIYCVSTYALEKGDLVRHHAAAMQDFQTAVPSPVFTQAIKSISHYAVQYLKDGFCHAEEMDPQTRPEWLDSFMEDSVHGKRISVLGRVARSYFQNEQDLIQKSIEINFANKLGSFLKRVTTAYKEDNYLLPQVILEVMDTASNYFFTIPPEGHQVSAEERGGNLKLLEEQLTALIFPDEEDDLFLPIHGMFTPYLRDKVFNRLKPKIVPLLVKLTLEGLRSELTRDELLLQGMTFFKKIVEHETPDVTIGKHTRFKSMEMMRATVLKLITTFFNYLETGVLTRMVPAIGHQALAQEAAEVICDELVAKSPSEILENLFTKLLPIMMPGGHWSEDKSQFITGELRFPHTVEDLDAERALDLQKQREVEEKLRGIAKELGSKTDGLQKVVHKRVFHGNQVHNSVRNVFAVEQTYNWVTTYAVSTGFNWMNVPGAIREVAHKVIEKMRSERHNVLIESILFKSVNVITRNV